MSVVDIQIAAVLESTKQFAKTGSDFRVWNGVMYPEIKAALEAKGVVVLPNVTACDPHKQWVFYNIGVLPE